MKNMKPKRPVLSPICSKKNARNYFRYVARMILCLPEKETCISRTPERCIGMYSASNYLRNDTDPSRLKQRVLIALTLTR